MLIADNTLNIAEQQGDISKVATVSQLVEIGASAVLAIGTLALLFFLITGALDWLMSGGDKGKVESGRNKIMQAIIGFIILASVFAIYRVVLQFTGVESVKIK